MDWCGIVGTVREVFRTKRIAEYHWMVPNISSMPRKVAAVHYSPSFRFMDATWFLGIYWNSDDWIGLEIWRRSTEHPLQRVRFSMGVMRDNLKYLLHLNQYYPEKDNVCIINQFLPLSILRECRDHLAPWDTLTITGVIWPDVPFPDEIKRFWNSELSMNLENEECGNEKEKSSIPIASKFQKSEMLASLPNIEINGAHSLDVIATEQHTMLVNSSPVSIAEKLVDSTGEPRAEVVPEPPKEMLNSNASATKESVSKSGTHFGILREFSKGVEWEVALPPATSKSTWNFTSPRLRCGELRCFFNLRPRTDEDMWLRFTILSEDANFSLPIRWRLSVKSHDPQGLVGIINGWRSGDLENNQYVQEISLQRDDMESCLASGARITFVCHLSIGEIAMAMEDSIQQREKILVSCETQTEDDPDVEPTEIHRTVDLKESEECDLWCLEIPQEEECVRHIQQTFERNLQKLLSENPKSLRKRVMSAA